MWNMMCDVMPTIAEDSLGQRGQFSADEANFEQLMVNILDERDKLLETLRDTQENLANSHIKLNDLTKEKEALQRQLQANLPQVIIYFFIFLYYRKHAASECGFSFGIQSYENCQTWPKVHYTFGLQ